MVDLSAQNIVNRPFAGNDGTTFYEVAKWVALAGILVALFLTSASIRNEILVLQYGIEETRQNNETLKAQTDLLRARLQTLASPAEIERTAQKLGLISSNDARVLILEGGGFPAARNLVAQSDTTNPVLHE